VGFDPLLELLPRAERHHRPGSDRDFLAGLRIPARALVLAPQVEVAEARQLDLAALLQRLAQHVEERIDEFLRLALVQPDVFIQPFGHFRLGQRHYVPLPQLLSQDRIAAPWSRSSAVVTEATTASTSRSVNVRDSSCRIKPIARLLDPDSTPLPA